MKRRVTLAVGTGVCLVLIAPGAWPAGEAPEAAKRVTAVVRNDLGQLKWVATEATDYTPLEAEGRRVYQRGGCNYCHSQFVRPVSTLIGPHEVVQG